MASCAVAAAAAARNVCRATTIHQHPYSTVGFYSSSWSPPKKSSYCYNSIIVIRSSSSSNNKRSFSSSSSSNESPPPLAPCDIVKGPSLLRTSVHRPRPSLLHLPALRALPFWTQQQQKQQQQQPMTKVAYQDPSLTWLVQHFETHWSTILNEYQAVAPTLPSDYQVDTEHSLHEGSWDWHSYMLKGQCPQSIFERNFPRTAQILQQVRDRGQLFEQVPFGYAFFSTLYPKSRIQPHSAPMNLRIRLHLPLIVPQSQSPPPSSSLEASSSDTDTGSPESSSSCGIRVGSQTRQWIPGKAMLLDDSFDHEVWNHTEQSRVLLLVDVWHPDVTLQERHDIVALFDHAKKEGWWQAPSATK